ncbi:hypothetical protein BGM26_00980 [Bacillus sp. FJAT-29790]|uniref:DUF5667 domain-containing protein n=1 Tax=Bacillus sp. FJAT-29790 TaxID=1895002 RepID=UPI001C2145FE|nr:DUF5667 domain-containing protein [Bacillus sp. FJAT-29790]MBU8877561.1 hypothetical protein [Bacillus sp. FJAT-29790]
MKLKFLSNKEMNKIAKSTLAIVLAGTFTFSSSLAYASEKTDENEKYETVVLENQTSTESDVKSVEVIEEGKDQVEEIEKNAPSLVAGNFFYFAKIALEKIKLAFTFDKVKESELLATYASERLAEAEILFAEGDEEKALQTIEKAIEYMQSVEILVEDEDKDDAGLNDEVEIDEPVTDEEKNTDTNETKVDEVNIEDDGTKDDSAIDEVTQDDSPIDDVNAEESVSKDEPMKEVKELISQNILALQAALNKVKNPVAKAALQKNIEKSYAKLAKKIAKIEKKYAELDQHKKDEVKEGTELVKVEEEVIVDSGTDAEIPNDVKTEVDKEEIVTPVKHHNEAKSELKQQRKEAREEYKEKKAEIKEEAKQSIKAIKQEEKQSIKAVKQEAKHADQTAKQEARVQRDEKKAEMKQQKESKNQQVKKHQENWKQQGNDDNQGNEDNQY